MEGANSVTCPVCTLYLRPGMTLENHLATHPKQKVIEALLRVTQPTSNECNVQPQIQPQLQQPPLQQPQLQQQPQIPQGMAVPQITQQGISMQMNQLPQNQSFFYQQFTATTGNQFINPPISPINNLNQQQQQQQFIAIPAYISPQMMSPFVFQQQQQVQIVTASSNFQPFLQRPPEISPTPAICESTITEIQEPTTSRSSVISINSINNRTSSTSELIREKLLALELNKVNEPIVIEDEKKEDFDGNEAQHSTTNETEEKDTEIIENEIHEEPEMKENDTQGSDIKENEMNENEEELNKACQTTQEKDPLSNINVAEASNEGETILPDPCSDSDFRNKENITNMFEVTDSELESNRNEINKSMLIESSLNFILPNDITASEIEMVKENEKQDEPILMNMDDSLNLNISVVPCHKLGGSDFEDDDDRLDELSHQSLNIRADEKMPARGELSEQESNGASEIGWGRIYQEGSSGISTSYDLIARESWEASDCSDTEMPPLQSRIQPPIDYSEDIDEPDPIFEDKVDEKNHFTFDCSTCEQSFRCPKERRVHQAEHQTDENPSSSSNSIIEESPRKKIKNSEEETEIKPDISENKPQVVEEGELLLCNICGELLPSMKDLTAHNKKQHNIGLNQNFMCKTCNEAFHRQRDYIKHLKVHPLECIICNKLFYKPANLKVHIKRHTGTKPHKCEICGKAFFAKQKLREHLNIHNNISPIKCTQCDESFKRYSNLVQHRNHHHLKIRKKTRDYICHCGEICHSKSKFNWHKETHEPKPKSCTYCNEKFIHLASLTRHIRRAHNNHYVPDENRKCENVECDICKGVYLKSSLDAHLNIHTGKKPYTCTICNKEFTTKWNLKLHRWIHAAPTTKPYKCDVCQNAYFRESDYNAHMNSHRSVKPYTCNYCGCKFIRKYNCIRHVKEHEENKNFTCEVCNKSFHRSYYLKEHMRVHTGVRPYSCNICGKTSTTKSNHNKHMKIHHAREPVTTEG